MPARETASVPVLGHPAAWITVRVRSALVVPGATTPKSTTLGLIESAPGARLVPLRPTETVTMEPVTTSAAIFAPALVGANRTATVQLAAGARSWPAQPSFVMWNMPGSEPVRLVLSTPLAVLPVFVNVAVWVDDTHPMITAAKSTWSGVTARCAAAASMPTGASIPAGASIAFAASLATAASSAFAAGLPQAATTITPTTPHVMRRGYAGIRPSCDARGVKRAIAMSVLLACGGGKPTPVQPVATTAPTTAPPAPSCRGAAQALVHERGLGKVAKDRQDDARAAAEAEVVAACLDDQWTTVVVMCAATRDAPSTCLGQLTEDQEQSVRAHLSDWETNWIRSAERRADEPPHRTPASAPVPGDLPEPQAPAEKERIVCPSSLGDVASYEPQLERDAVDRVYAVVLRKDALLTSCERHWANPARKCFAAATTAADIAACRAALDAPGKHGIVNALANADASFAQVEALKKNPHAIDCAAVARAHYTDAVLRETLTALEPAERKRVFAESRTVMAATCATEKWAPTIRACIVRAPSFDLEPCFQTEGVHVSSRASMRFKIPAQGVFFKSGIAECDALADLVKKLMACDKLDPRMRAGKVELFSIRLAMWLDTSGGSGLDVGKQCTETQTDLEQDARERGCAL